MKVRLRPLRNDVRLTITFVVQIKTQKPRNKKLSYVDAQEFRVLSPFFADTRYIRYFGFSRLKSSATSFLDVSRFVNE